MSELCHDLHPAQEAVDFGCLRFFFTFRKLCLNILLVQDGNGTFILSVFDQQLLVPI